MAQIGKSVAYNPDTFGQGNLPAVGKYHGIILKAEEPNQNGQCLVTLQVLAGTTPGQEGKTIDDRYFPFNEKAADRLKHLWYITQVATLAQINSGEDIPMSSLLGKQILFEVVMSKPRTVGDKTYDARPQVGWRPESVDCMVNGWEAVPRNEKALKGELSFDDTPGVGGDQAPPAGGAPAAEDPFNFG